MKSPKPQDWVREYFGGIVMRIQTDREGRWRVTGDGTHHRESPPAHPLRAMQQRADALACAPPMGPWRRMCQLCSSPMALESRNRPDSGPDAERSDLWVCSSALCKHAEPADD
jgi:hypothetical protein